MTQLEKIQNHIAEELLCCAEFTNIPIWKNHSFCKQFNAKNATDIIVNYPLPKACAEKSNNVFFTNVEVCIEISFQKNITNEIGLLENICRRLHNKKLFGLDNCGKLLLRKSQPFEFSETSNLRENVKIFFDIDGVLL